MAKRKELKDDNALPAIRPANEVEVLPPESGVVGDFLDGMKKTFKARAMRMGGLMKRIDESGQRMETILRMAAEKAEAAESALQAQLEREGLADDSAVDEDAE